MQPVSQNQGAMEGGILNTVYNYFFGVTDNGDPAPCAIDYADIAAITACVDALDEKVSQRDPETIERFKDHIGVIYVPFKTEAAYLKKASGTGAHVISWDRPEFGLRAVGDTRIHLFSFDTIPSTRKEVKDLGLQIEAGEVNA